ncbi:MAG: hypothetical protein Q9217_000525 [Psora testacea]
MAAKRVFEEKVLYEHLASGFDILLGQFDRLKSRNSDLERRLCSIEMQNDESGSFSDLPKATSQPEATGLEPWESIVLAKAVKARDLLNEMEKSNKSGPLIASDTKREEDKVPSVVQSNLPEGHPAVPKASASESCPFVALSTGRKTKQQSVDTEASVPRRPDSLPTPPGTSRHFEDERAKGATTVKNHSPPPSITASVSKCPIRMLDERPAEEIAAYFKEHQHEIPRSHAVCVKRYQSNAQSIRQLDAKYGDLVDMIQGLGMKHQPLLPTKEEGEQASVKPKSDHLVEEWADQLLTDAVRQPSSGLNEADPEEREGYFNRSLREIRVGESPSRPWGISVPVIEPTLEDVSEGVNMGSNEPEQYQASVKANEIPKTAVHDESDVKKEEKPQMIFTGPVFIGYPPNQAAALMRRFGTSIQAKPP